MFVAMDPYTFFLNWEINAKIDIILLYLVMALLKKIIYYCTITFTQ